MTRTTYIHSMDRISTVEIEATWLYQETAFASGLSSVTSYFMKLHIKHALNPYLTSFC